jgi:hypothetical protein
MARRACSRGLAASACVAAAVAWAAPSIASEARMSRQTFGGKPIPISLGPGGKPANGSSGGGAVSGDDRKARLAAFYSAASNLVKGDGNGHVDVFVWQRPRGNAGLTLSRPGGVLKRASVSSGGAQANGESRNPSLDGSLKSTPHCVAFQSTASNLAAGDSDPAWDVYVRDLRSRKTRLVSRGIAPDAVNASINGRCSQVAFESDGSIYVAGVGGGKPRRIAAGQQPSFARDGSAIVWSNGGSVFVRRAGHITKVRPGGNPRVSDEESGVWGVSFESSSKLAGNDRDGLTDVYTRVVRRSGGATRTDLISTARGGAAYNGGITSFGTNRGIVVFGIREGRGSALWYRNNNSGNIDDMAFSGGQLTDVATSARANFIVFSSTGKLSRFDRSPRTDVYFKHTKGGEPY